MCVLISDLVFFLLSPEPCPQPSALKVRGQSLANHPGAHPRPIPPPCCSSLPPRQRPRRGLGAPGGCATLQRALSPPPRWRRRCRGALRPPSGRARPPPRSRRPPSCAARVRPTVSDAPRSRVISSPPVAEGGGAPTHHPPGAESARLCSVRKSVYSKMSGPSASRSARAAGSRPMSLA